MTHDDIIRMAEQAFDESSATDAEILRFATLVAAAERDRTVEIVKSMQEELQAKFEQTYMEGVIAGAAAEREACAKVCDGMEFDYWHSAEDQNNFTPVDCAAAIRARGEQA